MKAEMDMKQRLVSLVLLLASLMILMIGTCVRFSGWASVADEIEATLNMAAGFGSWVGLDIDTDGVRKVNRALSDGKVTGSEALTVTRQTAKVAREILTMDQDEDLVKLKNLCTLYSALSLFTLACAAVTMVTELAGKRTVFPLLYLAGVLAQFLAFISLGDGVEMTIIPFLALLVGMAAAGSSIPVNKKAARAPEEGAAPAAEVMGEIRDRLVIRAQSGGKAVLKQVDRIRDRLESETKDPSSSRVAFCKDCGARTPAGACFCGRCGAKI